MVLGTLAAGSLPFWVLALELRPLLDALTGDGIFIAPWRLAFVVAVYVAVTWLTGWLVCSVAVMRKVGLCARLHRRANGCGGC